MGSKIIVKVGRGFILRAHARAEGKECFAFGSLRRGYPAADGVGDMQSKFLDKRRIGDFGLRLQDIGKFFDSVHVISLVGQSNCGPFPVTCTMAEAIAPAPPASMKPARSE